jgi:hypothetical protein
VPIYIAKNYDGKTISIVLARDATLANAYWQGKDIFPHSTHEYTEDDLKEHITGVLPIYYMGNCKEKT